MVPVSAPAAVLRVTLPVDLVAEHDLAGCGIVAREAAARAVWRGIGPEAFYDVRAWEALVAVDMLRPDDDLDASIAKVAAYIEAEPAEVRSWVENRSVYADKSGTLAARVLDVAQRRANVRRLLRELQATGAVEVLEREVPA